jgi:hypothetical protein
MPYEKTRNVHPSITEIDKNFENLLTKREENLKSGRLADTFDECVVSICIDSLKNAFRNSENPAPHTFKDGDSITDVFEIVNDRVSEAFCGELYELVEEEDHTLTTEQIINAIREFFEDIEDYQDGEEMYIEDCPDVEPAFQDAYSDYRTIEAFFRKHEPRLSI